MQPSPDDIRERIRATFNAAAEHFDDPPLSFWDHFGSRTVELAGIRPGYRVLDVCCGTGASALPAARAAGPAGRVVGVDLAENLLRLAREKAARHHLANAEFTSGDMTSLEFPPESFDAVLCVFGIFFVPDMEQALAGLWRLVGEGGTLAVTVWGPRILEPGNTIFWDALDAERPDLRPKVPPWLRLSRAEGLHELFAGAGVPAPEIVEESLTSPITPEGYWTVVLGSGYRGFVDQLEPEAAGRLHRRIVERVEQDAGGRVVSDVLYAVATKAAAEV